MFEWWHKYIECRAEMYPQFVWRIPIMQVLAGSYMPDEANDRPEFSFMQGVTLYIRTFKENKMCSVVEIWLLANEYTQASEDQMVYKATGTNLDGQWLVNQFLGDLK